MSIAIQLTLILIIAQVIAFLIIKLIQYAFKQLYLYLLNRRAKKVESKLNSRHDVD